ncbi:MAG: peptidylprolyl isomerase [Agarilytica sp.]
MTENLAVGEGTVVTLHFSLALESGEEIDSNFGANAPSFSFGDGSLMPGFEEVLVGLKSGDKQEFVIPPEKGFGQPNQSNVQEVRRESFGADLELAEGLVVSFADPAGGEMPGVVRSFDEEKVEVDFNHPLSGRDILFKVEIIDVKPAVTH